MPRPSGFFTFANPANTTRYEGVAGGDTLLAAVNTAGDPSSGWTLESNAQALALGPTAGAGNLQGPGNGEYFFPDSHPGGFHDELTTGAVLHLPGFPDVVASAFDPGLDVRTGGFMWLRLVNGTKTKGYEIYDTGFNPPPQATYSKANGFGELVAICTAAPIEVGNRVWDDVDGDGVQDPGEAGLDGVTVELLAPGGAVIAPAVTANGGQYYFSSGAGSSTGYQIYGIAGLLADTAGYQIRVAPQVALGGGGLTLADADASANGNSRDSGALSVGGNFVVGFATGPAGANDHTFDLGFTTAQLPILSLGDLVWYDTNDNAVVDASEAPLPGVDLVLYRDNGDGVFSAATDSVVATQTTGGTGRYLFSALVAGNYFVQVPAAEFGPGQTLEGYRNSTAQFTGDAANNRDHGAPAPVAGQGTVSELVTLAVGTEPTGDDDTDADANTNTTIDFGFYRLVLGNLVWVDADDNGVVSGGESGLDGVPVELLDGTGVTVLQATATAGGGLYQFVGLAPGEYRVRITPPPGLVSSSGPGYEPAADPDDDVDNDDDGTTTGATITSLPILLAPGSEPTVLAASGTTANTTLDFGLSPASTLCLGNLVWLDLDADGRADSGEPGIAGVTVRLIAANGVTILATTTTDPAGHYAFCALPPGTYFVEIDRGSGPIAGYPGAGGFPSVRASAGVLAGGPGRPEIIVGAGPGGTPGIVSVAVSPAGAVAVRLGLLALEEP
jgi:protocatechuate 3,4-dioxygenase beta subunit